jgi:hypothetical protein
MAAGLGYKEFSTGDVLTAADANGYLASQVVMVFASAAARTSAIASPQEGMISYLKDTNSTEYYSGSAWVAIGGASSDSFTSLGSGSLSSNTLTLGSISSAYKDLRVILKNVQVASAADVIVNVNSSTNLDYLQLRAANTTPTTDAVTATANWYLNNNQLNTGSNNNIVVLDFPNYAETSGNKIVNSRSRFYANTQSQQMIAGATILTASAISEIVIKTGGANFAGGTYEIWGIK